MGRYCVSVNCKDVQCAKIYFCLLFSVSLCILYFEMKTQQTNKQNQQQYSCVLCWFFRKMSPHRVWPIVEHKSIQCLQPTKHLCRMCLVPHVFHMLIAMRKCIHMWLKPILDDFHTFQPKTKALHSANDRPPSSIKFTSYSIRLPYVLCIQHSWHSIIFNISEFRFFIYHFNHSGNRHH